MMAKYRGCDLPEDLYYDLDYVWLRLENDGTITVGVTDPAQTLSGRVQAAQIKKPGTHINAGRHVAVLESGKWVGGLPVPFSATVLVRNQALLDDPHLINVDPYGDAWVARLRPDDPAHVLDKLSTGAEAVEALRRWIDRYDVECLRCAD